MIEGGVNDSLFLDQQDLLKASPLSGGMLEEILRTESFQNVMSVGSLVDITRHLSSMLGTSEDDEVVTLIASTCLCFYQLYRSRSSLDVGAAIGQWTMAVLKRNMSFARENVEVLANYMNGLRTEAVSEKIESFLGMLKSAGGVKIFEQLREIFVSMISLRFFGKDYKSLFKDWLGHIKSVTWWDFIITLLETSVTIVKAIENYLAGLPVWTELFGGDPVRKALAEVERLVIYEEFLYSGLPVPGRMCRFEFSREISKHLDFFSQVSEKMPLGSAKRNEIDVWIVRLLRIKNTLINSVKGKSRIPPFSVVVWGDPGIGKSKILPFIAKVHCAVKGREYKEEYLFSKQKDTEYWDGHDPLSEPYIHISEPGTKSKKLAQAQGEKQVDELLSLIDSLPYMLNMAFKDKGKVFATPEMVLVDANNPNMNIPHVSSNPGAYFRRFYYLYVRVKPEYCKPGSTALDSAKSLDDPDVMDRWLFTLTRRVPNGSDRWDEHAVGENMDIREMTSLLQSMMQEHIKREEAVMEKANSYEISDYMDEMRSESFMDCIREKRDVLKGYEVPEVIQEISGTILGYWKPHYFDLPGAAASEFVGNVKKAWEYKTTWVEKLSQRVSNGVIGGVATTTCDLVVAQTQILLWQQAKYGVRGVVKRLSILLFWMSVSIFIGGRATSLVTLIAALYLATDERGYVTSKLINIKTSHLRGRRDRAIAWLKALVYREDFDPYAIASPNVMFYGRIVAAFVSLGCLYKIGDWAVEKVTRPRTEGDLSAFEELQIKEKELECGYSYKRVPVHGSQVWNTVVPLRSSVSTLDPEQLQLSIQKNVREVEVIGNQSVTTKIVGIRGNLALVNRHAFGLSDTGKFLVRVWPHGMDKSTAAMGVDTQLYVSQLQPVVDDIVLVALSGVQFRDIIKHFVAFDVDTQMSLDGRVGLDGPTRVRRYNTGITISDTIVGAINVTNFWSYKWQAHERGACGTPVVAQVDAGSAIVGLHTGGGSLTATSVAVAINKRDLERAVDTYLSKAPFVELSSESDPVLETELPIMKSPFRFEVLHGLDYYGKVLGPTMMHKHSKLTATKLKPYVSDLIDEQMENEEGDIFGPPPMKPFTRDGVYYSPFNNALRKLGASKRSLDPVVMSVVIKKILERVLPEIPNLKPINVLSAINGAPQDPFIRSMNLSTASGFGWHGAKRDYFEKIESELWQDCDVPVEDLARKVLEDMKIMQTGVVPPYVFEAHPKDEARYEVKNRVGKTRIFYASPMEQVILARMFLSPFYSLMVEKSELFGSAVGIKMHTAGDHLVSTLTGFSPLLMEGDYSNFDQSMPFEVGWAANSVVYACLEHAGYSKAALQIVKSLLTANLYPYVAMNKDLFRVPSLQPSGKYATAEDNSLRNLILVMYCWHSLPELRNLDFFANVHVLTYGDDLLMAVKPAVAGLFNNMVYQEFCMSRYGISYTPAVKDAAMQDFKDIQSVSFLKRNFVYREDLGHWVCPLFKESLGKSLQWMLPSRVVTVEKQMLDTCTSFLWEWFFHTVEKEHSETRGRLIDLLVDLYGMERVEVQAVLPVWTEIGTSIGFFQ
jgi:hypothetical protein